MRHWRIRSSAGPSPMRSAKRCAVSGRRNAPVGRPLYQRPGHTRTRRWILTTATRGTLGLLVALWLGGAGCGRTPHDISTDEYRALTTEVISGLIAKNRIPSCRLASDSAAIFVIKEGIKPEWVPQSAGTKRVVLVGGPMLQQLADSLGGLGCYVINYSPHWDGTARVTVSYYPVPSSTSKSMLRTCGGWAEYDYRRLFGRWRGRLVSKLIS
jgi:hypothetical protein